MSFTDILELKTPGKFQLSLKRFVTPLLALTTLTTGIGLLYSLKWTILIFSLGLAFIVVFTEPFIGALIYLIILYARPMELIPTVRGMPLMKFVALGTLVLAIATFTAIIASREQEQKHRRENLEKESQERKRRLLAEIIQWATDVQNIEISISECKTSHELDTKAPALYLSLMARGEYITSQPPGLSRFFVFLTNVCEFFKSKTAKSRFRSLNFLTSSYLMLTTFSRLHNSIFLLAIS